ncbi:hypothetical protein MMC13_007520 [Lambiella insularis]|nr:hypothetical protein [Lambiella insularis]
MNLLASTTYAVMGLLPFAIAAPITCDRRNPNCGPIQRISHQYNVYHGKAAPFPADELAPLPANTNATVGIDDVLFQNLMSAEWVVFSFYQADVEAFNTPSFTSLGYPATTFARIAEIRDNEAGHLRIFENSISNASLVPGACKYDYGFGTSAVQFLAMQQLIELVSMSFLSGLARDAQLETSKCALVTLATVEARHTVWLLQDVYASSPFAGPSDTAYPYANQILNTTRQFIIPGSCPLENPPYPTPSQNLPVMQTRFNASKVAPDGKAVFEFEPQIAFAEGKEYFVVFSHGVENVTVPFDVETQSATIPDFDHRGLVLAVLADTPGAPVEQSVLAGPDVMSFQPSALSRFV